MMRRNVKLAKVEGERVFTLVVDNVKELVLENSRLVEENDELKRENKSLKSNRQKLIAEGFKDTEILPETKPGMSGPRNKGPEEKHDETADFMGITPQENGYNIVIHYRSPETGKDTTMHRVRDTFEEALIARNEIIATLRRNNLIDLEKFIKVIRN